MNAEILVIIRAKDIKLNIKVALYCLQIEIISN